MATHSSILAWRIPWTGEPFESTLDSALFLCFIYCLIPMPVTHCFNFRSLKIFSRGFPGSPMVRAPGFHFQEHSRGNKMSQAVWCGQKKKKKFLASGRATPLKILVFISASFKKFILCWSIVD